MNNSEIPQFLLDISWNIRNQDNSGTYQPCFCVQQQTFIGGLDPSLCDREELMYVLDGEALPESYWTRITDAVNDGDEEVSFGNEDDGTAQDFTVSEIETYGYKKDWETVQCFFTEEGAKKYIEMNGHNIRKYGPPRIYVESFHRNQEMICIREWLLALTSQENHS